MSVIETWGSTSEERAQDFPCQRFLAAPYQACFRAVDVAAPVALTFRWLCQMRVAPYSYDWLDNFGRESPRQRDPDNERLREGQRWMRVFRLVDFKRGEHLTLVIDGTQAFGNVAVTYAVRPTPLGSRVVVKLLFRAAWYSPQRWLLPFGDLVMMRKQLLTLKALAELEQHGQLSVHAQPRPRRV
jgi:hypothetical protein